MANNLISYEEKFTISPFHHIKVGDPLYFEKIEQGIDVSTYEKLVCNLDTALLYRHAGLKIARIETTYDDTSLTFNSIIVRFCVATKEKFVDTYLRDKYYGEQPVQKNVALGCDTACFELNIDGIQDIFHTGADGFFGELTLYKPPYGLVCELSFDEDLFSIGEIKTRMEVFFLEN